jgi:radical SAM protein (TIGR01212 family)
MYRPEEACFTDVSFRREYAGQSRAFGTIIQELIGGIVMVGKRYRIFSEELKRLFGCRVHRISVDGGFSCPNRDGTVGTDGCIYCGGAGSGSFGIARGLAVAAQLEQGKEVMVRKYKAARFIAYFQPYSNTYAPVARLRALYDEALAVPDVVGLIIGTRPDCLPPAVLELLAEYRERTYFWLELGLQSPLDQTLRLLQRGHDYAAFAEAVANCHRLGIRVCVHLILGLPGESREEMLATAGLLNLLGVAGVKIHLLHVMRGTPLADMHAQGMVPLLTRDDYVGLVCDFLERLDPAIIVQRVTGDGMREHLVAPLWSLAKFEVLNAIDAELERRGSRQGSRMEVVGGGGAEVR